MIRPSLLAFLLAILAAAPLAAQFPVAPAAPRFAPDEPGSEPFIVERADAVMADRRGVSLRCVTNVPGETPVWMRVGFSTSNAVVFRIAEYRAELSESGLEGSRVTRGDGALTLTRGGLTVEIELNPLRIEARSGSVRIALADSSGLPPIIYHRDPMTTRIREIAVATAPGIAASSQGPWYFGAYGSGAHAFGLRLNNRVMAIPATRTGRSAPGDVMPFAMSTAGYAFWAPPESPIMLDFRGDPLLIFRSNRCEFHFLLSASRALPALLAEVAKFTFDLPVPPASIFDPWISRDSFTPETEIVALQEKIRSLDLPSGVLLLDEWQDRPQFVFREFVAPSFPATTDPRRHKLAWTGTGLRDFRGLQIMLRAALAAGLSGLPVWGHDIAGWLGPTNPEDPEPTAELLIRWTELAAFSPVMQWHGRGVARDPWAHSDPQVLSTYRDYAWLHMNLRPYLVSESFRAKRTGIPLMRALVLGNPGDRDASDVDDEYELGGDLLVAPVMTQNVAHRPVYLPNGGWREFWTEIAREGRTIHSRVPAPLEIIPVFVRDGAILPLLLDGAFIPGSPLRDTPHLTLRVYPDAGGAARRTLYDALGRAWTVKHQTARRGGISIETDRRPEPVTFWIPRRATRPERVDLNGRRIPEAMSGASLARTRVGWWYDESEHRVLVKIPAGGRARVRIAFPG